MHPHTITIVTLVILTPLLAWRIYSRFRRMIGRQKLSRIRPWLTVFILPSVIVLLGYQTYEHYERIGSLIVGLTIGTTLGVFGLRKTIFETTDEGLFYTPNAYIGMSLLTLLVARVIYRFLEILINDLDITSNSNGFVFTPLTLACFGLLTGYYVCYTVGLIKWKFQIAHQN